MTTTTFQALTSRQEMENVFTVQGVEFRTNPFSDEPRCVQVINYFIQMASVKVLSYIGQRYEVATLRIHPQARFLATWIACYYLSQRAGNPSLFHARYEEAMQELVEIRDGIMPLLDANTRWDMVPTMSNMEHDPRYSDQTLRVDPETSTGNGGTVPRIMSDPPFGGYYST